jgi:hypothetical protein
MKLAILGSKSVAKAEVIFPLIQGFIDDRCPKKQVTILSGGGNGVSELTRKWSERRGFDFVGFLPFELSVGNADEVLAIWDGVDGGTQHAIHYAKKLGVPVMIIRV